MVRQHPSPASLASKSKLMMWIFFLLLLNLECALEIYELLAFFIDVFSGIKATSSHQPLS